MAADEGGASGSNSSPGASGEGTSNRRIVTVALMMAMAVAAMEQTVVSPAMPTIIARLKGVEIYALVFSAYLLASTITTPLYGKLADRHGRKRVLLFGLGLFGVGSMLSGLSRSMPELIAMRVVQGLGAGAVAPIVLTILGDLYTLEERARVQGLFSGVWGVSSIAGPALGGALTDQLSWRWVFFVSVPFGLIAMLILAVGVKETVAERESRPLDLAGAAWLTGGTAALLLAVIGGEGRPWELEVVLLGLAVGFLVLFVRQERRAADPVLPIDLLAQPALAASIAGSFIIGGLLIAIDTYVPLFVQGVRGGSATAAGRSIMPLFASWSVSVFIAAKLVPRWGFRRTAVVGSVLITGGSTGLVAGALVPEWSRPAFFLGMGVIGLGMGPTSLSYILGVQNAVAWDRRGAATGSVIFSRMIGGAVIVGLLGAVLGHALAWRLGTSSGVDIAAALRPETHGQLTAAQLSAVRDALGSTLRDIFLLISAMAVLGLACAARVAGGRAVDRPDAPASARGRGDAELLPAALET
ncbi:MFS transporter [Tautonia plasticadhaerens]|uniref:Multidrug resistance protein 3 n=1 Tax=Tautonia plasticadhaerens TaxID=2527974 RepID=A0A518H6V8_9BACT|nr:MFS transporter [Tautonia plasticadhaerens]QDV36573.1 Multidrug resistance protein 3 [Tautonia plasticadhaerens]